MDTLSKLKDAVSSAIKEDEILASHTTLRIGGPAKYFYNTDSVEELIKLVLTAEKIKLPYIMGI